jgi:phosphoribosylformimino-5-aminoimidazole carboxamide ribotide isomerase
LIVYPAIDIRGGRCVRLIQGKADQETVYAEDPSRVAEQFKLAGSSWVHVVDLDGAFEGKPKNLDSVKAIATVGLKVQLGGGLRSKESIENALAMGVSRVVIGTRAAESEAFVSDLVAAFGDRIAVGIDAKDGKVAVKGWVDTTDKGALYMAKRMDLLGVSTLIYTDIGTDGMLTGPNFSAQEALLNAVRCNVIASGGVSVREDVVRLAALAVNYPKLNGVIIGKAIYEGRVDLSDLLKLVKA